MSEFNISLIKENDFLSDTLEEIFSNCLLEESMFKGVLFGGDRWSPVEWVAVVYSSCNPVGLATLAPKDEEGNLGPCVIGLWVHPSHRRKGFGHQLLKVLFDKSMKIYQKKPLVETVTVEGEEVVKYSISAGVKFILKG